jgi:cysteine dioxygenase
MIDFMGCHRLENLSNERSMSLHIYAKPIRNCNAFDEDLGEFVRKDLIYNTVFALEETIK